MTVSENVERLSKHLALMEFDGDVKPLLRAFMQHAQHEFSFPYWKDFGRDNMKFVFHIQRDENLDGYRIENYEAILRKDFPIPEFNVEGVNTKDLADRMSKVDWTVDYDGEALYGSMRGMKSAIAAAKEVNGIMADLQTIGKSVVGREVQAMLLYKYWTDTPMEMHTSLVRSLQAKYEFKATLYTRFNITASEAYTFLNAKALSQQNNTAMNNDNLKFLSDRIQYAGFGEGLKADLEKRMIEGKSEFQLHFATEFSKKPFEATLNFRKSDTSDMYFFNSYKASMERNDGQKVEQKFYLNNGKGITAKEAFNLLDGRAVHKELVTKEGEKYKAWLQLNPEVRDKNNNTEVKQLHEKYGYNLEAAVGKFAVAELKDPEKSEKLMASLQKGNIQSVTIEKDGSTNQMFIEADPRYKTVKLYDAQMKLVAKDDLSRYQSAGQGVAVKAVKEGETAEKKNEVSRQKKPDKEKNLAPVKSLLPKKRENPNKGLGVA